MPGERSSFGSPVEPISPPPKPALESGLGWRRRVPPPGPKDLLRRPFIAIAALAGGKGNIGGEGRGGKGARLACDDCESQASVFRAHALGAKEVRSHRRKNKSHRRDESALDRAEAGGADSGRFGPVDRARKKDESSRRLPPQTRFPLASRAVARVRLIPRRASWRDRRHVGRHASPRPRRSVSLPRPSDRVCGFAASLSDSVHVRLAGTARPDGRGLRPGPKSRGGLAPSPTPKCCYGVCGLGRRGALRRPDRRRLA